MHILELQEDSSAAKYYVKIAQHYASMQEYEVRKQGEKHGGKGGKRTELQEIFCTEIDLCSLSFSPAVVTSLKGRFSIFHLIILLFMLLSRQLFPPPKKTQMIDCRALRFLQTHNRRSG